MMRGLPASGKSYRAKELLKQGGDFVRVNKDLLRKMLHNNKFNWKNESLTNKAQTAIVEMALLEGKNVIIDDTNLGDRHKEKWSQLARGFGAKFEIVDMNKEVDIYECLARDLVREKKVGRDVILNMAMQYGLFPALNNIVVVDIDGTVADCKHRQHHVRKDPKDWKAFFSEMGSDSPRDEVFAEAESLAEDEEAVIVFVTARPEDYRGITERWLQDNNMPYTHMLMRRSGDKRPDTEVKQDILNTYLKQYNIVQVFDDRPSVIQMWRDNGLEVTDVGEGIDF